MSKKWICVFSTLCIVLCISTACRKHEDSNNTAKVYGAMTTLDRTIVPDVVPVNVNEPKAIKPWSIDSFEIYGYGKWHYGPGDPCLKRLQLMPSGYTGATATNSTELLNFFTLTDIHIMDKETPTQAIFYSFLPYMWPNVISCYAPAMLYTTQTLDAAVRTINSLQKNKSLLFKKCLNAAAADVVLQTRTF